MELTTLIEHVITDAIEQSSTDRISLEMACAMQLFKHMAMIAEYRRNTDRLRGLPEDERAVFDALRHLQQQREKRKSFTNGEIQQALAKMERKGAKKNLNPHRATVLRILIRLEAQSLVYRPGGKGGRVWAATENVEGDGQAEKPTLRLMESPPIEAQRSKAA